MILLSILPHLQVYKYQQQHTSYILQQILDLKRLQLTDGSDLSPLISGQEQMEINSSIQYPPVKLDRNLDQHLQHSQDHSTDQQRGSSLQDLNVDTKPFKFSQQEHNIPSSSNVGLPMQGESFWQCKSPVQNSQVCLVLSLHQIRSLCHEPLVDLLH